MSLGFGRVAPGDWDKYKSGSSADMVDPADYCGKLTSVRLIDPSKNKKGLGTWIVAFLLTDANKEEWQGKSVEHRSMYHPDPDNSENPDGYDQMGEISNQNIVQLIEACGVECLVAPDGAFDTVATLQQLPDVGAEVIFTVSHSTQGGKKYQEVGNFRPVAG